MTEAPAIMTYASVVSRETVHIALTIVALDGLQGKAADITNAYITAPLEENIWTVIGPKFGSNAVEKTVIVCALYGLKSSSATFRRRMADCMEYMGFKSCLADPDLW